MIYVFLSVCCSVIVSVLLKLAKRYHIDVYQAITWNYSMAILLTQLFLKPDLHHLKQAPLVIYGVLGMLLPALFIVIAKSIKMTGIVRTDVAQRLSLFIPVIAAFLVFGEVLTVIKLIGIAIGFAAIVCSIPWQKQVSGRRTPANTWLYLLTVFMGMGVIDVLFKQVALFKTISSNTSLFIVYAIAFTVSLTGLIYQVAAKKMKFSWPHILIGWVLGIVNFGNILFYIKAHQTISKYPFTVFSSVNIGIIVLGTLTGLLIFREKLSALNKAGIALAIIAILIISYPDYLTHLFTHN